MYIYLNKNAESYWKDVYKRWLRVWSHCCCLLFSWKVMSNCLLPYGLQITRLLCPWDPPGKNTGVDYHALLQGIFLTQGSNPHLLQCQVDSLPPGPLRKHVSLHYWLPNTAFTSKESRMEDMVKREYFHLVLWS